MLAYYMLYNERNWAIAQKTRPDEYLPYLENFCRTHLFEPDVRLVRSVNGLRAELQGVGRSAGTPCGWILPYLLAKNFRVYALPLNGTSWPLWAHERDVPTMQAAHAQDPALRAYLRERAFYWSSNYIAADLRVDVWAARVCIDLYGISTPKAGYRPEILPQAEQSYTHDGERVAELFARGFTARQVATELGVTAQFLHANWKDLHISPQFGKVRDRAAEASKPRDEHATVAVRRDRWMKRLREGYRSGLAMKPAKTVSDAQHAWGTTYATARARLIALGWTPGEAVDTWIEREHAC